MSGGGTDTPSAASVKMRLSGQPRRPRPVSIATTGLMTSSMYEKRSVNTSNANTPTKPHFSGFDKSNTLHSVEKCFSTTKILREIKIGFTYVKSELQKNS